jgi:hypothetical protein
MKPLLQLIAAAIGLLPLLPTVANAREEIVRFANGSTGTVLKGKIEGRETVDYKITAKAGQSMIVELTSDKTTNYFNLLPPGSEEAIFIGSTVGNRFEGKLPKDGEYTVRLYLMGKAMSSGLQASYTLSLNVSDPAKAAPLAATPGFDQKLELLGISFHVQAASAGGESQILLTPSGLSEVNTPVRTPITGTITEAEVSDMNADGSPEVFVYVRKPGGEARGAFYAWSANRKKSLSDIHLQELPANDPAMAGHHGKDEYAVVEGSFIRRFPVAGGKTRQLQYKLKAGESGWQLRFDRMIEY